MTLLLSFLNRQGGLLYYPMDRAVNNRVGKGLRLISFDGGGIRSLSQLKIMENLTHRLEYKTDPEDSDQEILPCECVDMMAGSDTGGLIALMFGKLCMSVKDALKEFHKICSEVYTGDLTPEMRTERLKECIEDLLQRRGLPIDLKLGKDKRVTEQGCPCFVIATPKANMDSKVKLRTYRSRTEPSLDITLVDAVLATCATQPTFLSVSVGPELSRQDLAGGAMGTANPCRELVLEAQDKFGAKANISTIISLGSGHLGALTSPARGGKDEWIDVLRNMVESCERTAQEMETQVGHFDIYSRFSVEHGLQRLYGAQAEDFSWLNTQTVTYLQDVEVSRKLDVCIERIISQQDVITLEQLGLSSVPRADLHSMAQNILVSTQDEKLLEELRPKDVKGGPPVEECLEGTREDILKKIVDWINDLGAWNILWLKAHPGAGKTAIALTLVKRLRHLGRLGSSFFFQRAKVADLTPHALWCKAAFNLACKNPTIKATVITKLKEDREVPNTSNLDDLFHQLIEEPLLAAQSMSIGESLVIIVDALDECGGLDGPHSRDRKDLLHTLQKWSTLPRGFKLIVTSRGEDDIGRVLQPISHVVEISTGSNIRDKSWHDIKQFLTLRFEDIAKPYSSLEPDWPGDKVIKQLADRAGGLFIWARTVVDLIGRGAVKEQLSRILEQTSGMGNMAALYSQILRISFPEETPDILEAFSSTLGTTIFAKRPLSLVSLSRLFSIDPTRVEHICTKLKSVIHVDNTIQVMHQSFVDFLLDSRACPSAFYIRPENEEKRLALACLQVMRQNLRFNICKLESSCLLNSEVQDMESRINQNIPDHVLYSCRYGVEHIALSKYDAEVMGQVRYFTENQFLFWLEVLSVTNQINITPNLLLLMMGWMKKHNQDELMVTEMKKFATTFASVIAQSAPHIYISALPLAPRHSAVSKSYGERYPGLLRVERGGLEEWPGFECVMYGHKDVVSSVAISQDGTRIVSGSDDETVRMWDAATGQQLGTPFEGHTDCVTSVAFSPDGARIVSGSADKTVRVWDAVTGQPLGAPFEGHTELVSSVAFSPDGTLIVSGSGDETLRTWDVATGQPLGAPFIDHAHWVTSVAFSPDGTRVVSGSGDETVRMWDAATSQPLGTPFKGHTDWVRSVTFSPDGTRIASCSNDETVRVWDVATGHQLGAPFEGHTGWVTSVTFSSDGTRILSGSDDKTVRVWDAATSQQLGVPFERHADDVTSVAFSPDGTYIVSGFGDRTVRIWDTTAVQIPGAPFERHTDDVTSVAILPDGTCFTSSSDDGTACIWDETADRPLGTLFRGHTGEITLIASSPDSARIVSRPYDESERMLDAATGRLFKEPFEGPNSMVRLAECLPYQTTVFEELTPEHERMHVWQVATNKFLRGPFEDHTSGVSSIAFSLDGTHIFTGSNSKAVRMWDTVTYDTDRALLFRSSFKIDRGWVLNSISERLFYILPSLQDGLWLPGGCIIIGNRITKVNMERFQYGKSWTDCQRRILDNVESTSIL